MRISDWSSDLCSSDLIPIVENMQARQLGRGRLERHIGGTAACARLLDRQQRVLPLALARLAYRIILRRDLRDIRLALGVADQRRSEEHKSELQSLMRISYAVRVLEQQKQSSQKR